MGKLESTMSIEDLTKAIDCSYDGIHILDKDGNTLYINSACERIEGVNLEEIKKRNIKELVDLGYYNESVTLKVLEEKKAVTIVQKANNGKVVLTTGNPIYKNGTIDKVVVNSRDVTELRMLKEELEQKEKENSRYKEELELLRNEQMADKETVYKSEELKKMFEAAKIVAKVDSTVLILGESGVGKGVLSRFIHKFSMRKDEPYVKVDCSAIPEALFESEIFGYEKGAFTGAEKSGKKGLIEIANGGTVFLDEVGELPIASQAKLMRVIQEKEIVRVGGTDPIKVDVRVIAATNRNIKEMVSKKEFREDLYYRLNVVPIEIPPLRERKDDILPLVNNLLHELNKKYGFNKKMTNKALNELTSYDWPGNVRELENFVERIVVISEKELIDDVDLVSSKFSFLQGEDYKSQLMKFEKEVLESAIEKYGSIPKAAEKLSLDVSTVRRKLYRLNTFAHDGSVKMHEDDAKLHE